MNQKNLIEAVLSAIKSHGPESVAFPSIGLFAAHHREEISPNYWLEHTATAAPSLDDILSILVPIEPENNELEDEDDAFIDFTLPGAVTQYLLSVTLDDSAEIVEISMES